MKAVILDAHGDSSHFRLVDIPVPQPQQGEVRVRVHTAAFNPVDYKLRLGLYGGPPPMILGADFSGVVDAVGEGVDHLAVGDEVYGMSFCPCSNGSYAEYLTIPTPFVAKKPAHLSFEEAAGIPLVSLTAYRAMVASGALSKKGPIFIAGAAGGVGSIGVQLAQHFHGGPIFSVAGSEASAAWLTEKHQIPSEQILIYTGLSLEQLQEKLIAMNGGRLFPATIDFVGDEMKRLCVSVTGHSGHMVSVPPEEPGFDLPVWTRGNSICQNRNVSVHLIFVGSEAFSGGRESWKIYQDHFGHITELLESRAIQAPHCQSVGSLSVATVQEAHRLLEGGRVKGKLVMRVGK